jgi:hypothetical protein
MGAVSRCADEGGGKGKEDSQMAIPAAPMRRRGRRPYLSTARIPGTVMTTLTTFVMIVMVKACPIPALRKYWVP